MELKPKHLGKKEKLCSQDFVAEAWRFLDESNQAEVGKVLTSLNRSRDTCGRKDKIKMLLNIRVVKHNFCNKLKKEKIKMLILAIN